MIAGRSQTRSLILLAASLGLQVLLLAAQIKRDQDVRLIRVWAVEMVAPLGRSTNWLADGIRGGWTNYVGFRGLGRENKELRAAVDRLKLRNAELEGRAAEADRLAGLLDFRKRNQEISMVGARVIGASPTNNGRVAFLDRGARDGVALNMGVITPEGVIGKIIAAFPATSQVLLINDKDSGVGALLAGTRTQGPVRGSGEPLLSMEYIAKEVKVTAGEAVVTSGQDRIFPKDLPVGIVQAIDANTRTPFQKIFVKPAASLDRIEEVFILLTREEFTPGGITQNRVEGPAAVAAQNSAATAAAPPAASAARATAPPAAGIAASAGTARPPVTPVSSATTATTAPAKPSPPPQAAPRAVMPAPAPPATAPAPAPPAAESTAEPQPREQSPAEGGRR